jgi:radical SAM protein with 4Fe4S-binding SPASM domain
MLVPGVQPASELCGQCWSGKLCIDASGDAYPCVFSRNARTGNVLEVGLAEILSGTRLQNFRRNMFLGNQGG